MYISVIPLSHSLSTEPYTYFVAPVWEESVYLGALVEIPLGRYSVKGIVAYIGITVDPDLGEIRPIMTVISSVALITPSMVDMVTQIARRYSLPIHKALSLFLPSPLLSRLDKKNYILSSEKGKVKSEKSHPPKREIHHYIDTIFSREDMLTYFSPGTIFSFPDDFFLFSFFHDRENGDIPYTLSTIANESTPTKKSQSWIDIYEKKYDIFAGTRRILYYNLSQYSHLIYVEDAFGSEQFSYPSRLRNMDILRALADSSTIDITIVSSTPTLSLLADFRDFDLKYKRN